MKGIKSYRLMHRKIVWVLLFKNSSGWVWENWGGLGMVVNSWRECEGIRLVTMLVFVFDYFHEFSLFKNRVRLRIEKSERNQWLKNIERSRLFTSNPKTSSNQKWAKNLKEFHLSNLNLDQHSKSLSKKCINRFYLIINSIFSSPKITTVHR